jgi:hypothetical protein
MSLKENSAPPSDQFGSIRKRSLDRDLLDELWHAFHDLVSPEDASPARHQLCDRRVAIADPLQEDRGEESDRLTEKGQTSAQRHERQPRWSQNVSRCHVSCCCGTHV